MINHSFITFILEPRCGGWGWRVGEGGWHCVSVKHHEYTITKINNVQYSKASLPQSV